MLLCFVLVGLVLGLSLISQHSSEDKEIIDAFANCHLSFKGIDESGVAEISSSDILYQGNDEATKQLLNDLVYEVSPKKGLSNGDEVIVKLRYSQALMELSTIRFKEDEMKFKVNGLASSDRQKINSLIVVKDQEGNDVEVETEHFLIDGVEIPTYWNLTDDEIQAYINSVKQSEQSPSSISENVGVEDPWIQGESNETTERKSADFITADYLNNSITAYKQAYQYGIESSQEFKIQPIIEDSKGIGYRCIFKDEVEINNE